MLCDPLAWPCTCSPLGHTRACSCWGPDCGSTVPAGAMELCRKTSPELAGLDKEDEIINKTLPLWCLSMQWIKKLQTVFPSTSTSPQQTQCFGAKACEFSSPAHSFGSSAETDCTWLWSDEWCERRSSSPLRILGTAWGHRQHFCGPAVHRETWTW